MNQSPYSLQSIFLSSCEELCNRALRYDQGTLNKVRALDGNTLKFCTSLPTPLGLQDFSFYLHFTSEGLIFSSIFEKEFEAQISANTLRLLIKFLQQKPISTDDNVEIIGDLELVEHCQQVLRNLDIDWEEALSKLSGDVIAHEIGNAARGFKKWLTGRRDNFKENLEEFIQEESEETIGEVVNREDIHSFSAQVNSLNQDLKTIEARLSSVKEKLDQ